jgi:hypothetical protein
MSKITSYENPYMIIGHIKHTGLEETPKGTKYIGKVFWNKEN